MKSFINDYVSAVSTDPNTSWKMLTPKFQQESGGFDKYRSFWDPATNGRVTSISANPENLSVSYQVHFDHFKNGPGPTVLDLTLRGRPLPDRRRAHPGVHAGRLTRLSRTVRIRLPGVDEGGALEVVDRPVLAA